MTKLLLLTATLMVLTSTAFAGGIGLHADVASSPCDIARGGVALKVTTLDCGTPRHLSLQGRAEGIVNGKRASLPLEVRKTTTAGVYDVAAQWPASGRWVLVFTTSRYGQNQSLIVDLGADGGFVPVSPKETSRGLFHIARTETVRGKVATARLEELLKG